MKYFYKTALRRWAREIPRLSLEAVGKLNKSLPKGTTGSISKSPIGKGRQGKIFPTFTAGEGHTVAKIYHNDAKMNRITSVYLRKATKQGDKDFLQVHKVLPKGKGHISERLVPFASKQEAKDATVEAWKKLDQKSGFRRMATGHFDGKRGVVVGDVGRKNVMKRPNGNVVIADPAIGGRNWVEYNNMLKDTVKGQPVENILYT